jgi:hypothetical protein
LSHRCEGFAEVVGRSRRAERRRRRRREKAIERGQRMAKVR